MKRKREKNKTERKREKNKTERKRADKKQIFTGKR
jgi:hypothetical protein